MSNARDVKKSDIARIDVGQKAKNVNIAQKIIILKHINVIEMGVKNQSKSALTSIQNAQIAIDHISQSQRNAKYANSIGKNQYSQNNRVRN